MDQSRIAEIADKWMIPTSKTAYMAGLEKKTGHCGCTWRQGRRH
jgi:hypothetical protein